ncbi:hypothetical protein C492_19122 [Natronococcus jeotgali DSM 18795]|uniref:Uncharacterized protein n=2 Tax=Natronococcus jeotgali TaxID=413812 RepID=L9WTM5_9EURY|nr:hypothetical protein C492_19122 [Natronococcus jeotgali DSM 18795]
MEKPVRQLDTSLYRVFAPVGDFETLLRVRRAYAETSLLGSLDNASDASKNLGQIRTDSAGFQVLDFFSEIRRHANVKQTDGIRTLNERLPTAVRMFDSTPMKSGRPIRGIGGFDQVAVGAWIYELVDERGDSTDEPFSYEGESGTYWPFSAVLSWYASIELPGKNSVTHEQDVLAYGLLERDLQRVEDGVFHILKIIHQNREEVTAHGVLPRDSTHHYFATIMRQAHQTETDEQVSDDVMESIQRLGKAVGRAFHDRKDIGVLSSLKNANTYDEFLVALEDAALEVQKRRTEDSDRAEAGWYESEDIDRFLMLLNQSSNFASAKRMFVIHVCLEAQRIERASQYNEENSTESNNE